MATVQEGGNLFLWSKGGGGVMEKSGTGHDITEEACVGIDFCIKTLLSNNDTLRKKSIQKNYK